MVVAIDRLASLDEPSARVRADPPHDVVEGAGQIGVEELGEQPCRDVDGLEAYRETRISRDRGAAGEAALHVVSRGYTR